MPNSPLTLGSWRARRPGYPLWPVLLGGVLLTVTACGVLDELNPQMHFGSRAELPDGVEVPQDFEREADGFAVDIPQAFERYYACIDDVGQALGDPGLDNLSDTERELYALLCSEAAGNGWSPGNRPDEARLLNEHALETTRCIRERGWDYPDPRPEQHGRFLEVEDPAVSEVTDIEAEPLSRDVAECMDEHAIDWSEWVIENPRN